MVEAEDNEATLQLGSGACSSVPQIGATGSGPRDLQTTTVAPGLAMGTHASHSGLAAGAGVGSQATSTATATRTACTTPCPKVSDDPLFDLLDDGGDTLELHMPLAAPPSPDLPKITSVRSACEQAILTSESTACEPAVLMSEGICSSGLRLPDETSSKAVPPSLIGGGLKRGSTQILDLDHDASKEALATSADGSAYGEQAATLVSTNSATAPDIPISCKPVLVGRGEHATVQLADLRASAEQFIVRAKSASNASYELEDISRNGTFVSKKLVKGATVELRNNDLIEVLPAVKVGRAAAVGFLFQAPSKPDTLLAGPKRSRIECLGKEKADIVGTSSTEDIFEGAMCIICQEVMHRATSLQPCLHSFCSTCLSAWLQKPGLASCPLCRKPVEGVTRNHTLSGLIDGLLKAHPTQQRPAADLAQLEAQDALHDVDYDLAKLRSGPSSAVVEAGAAALTAASGTARVGLGLAVAAVPPPPGDNSSASEGSVDESEDHEVAHPPCFCCGSASWQTLSEVARGATAGASGRDLARTAFHGNDFEAEIL